MADVRVFGTGKGSPMRQTDDGVPRPAVHAQRFAIVFEHRKIRPDDAEPFVHAVQHAAQQPFAIPQCRFGPRALDRTPGALRRLARQGEVIGAPGAGFALIDDKQRGKSPIGDERYADRGTRAEHRIGRPLIVVEPGIGQAVRHARHPARSPLGEPRLLKAGQRITAGIAGHAVGVIVDDAPCRAARVDRRVEHAGGAKLTSEQRRRGSLDIGCVG
jgi:hypothetical protein